MYVSSVAVFEVNKVLISRYITMYTCILVEDNIKGTELRTFPMYQLRTDEVDTLFNKTWLI